MRWRRSGGAFAAAIGGLGAGPIRRYGHDVTAAAGSRRSDGGWYATRGSASDLRRVGASTLSSWACTVCGRAAGAAAAAIGR